MKFDTDKEGLHTLFRPYQALLLEHLWEINRESRVGVNSRQAHRYMLDKPEKISRASVINFLNDMVDEGILNYEEKTGKGGYHRIYYPKMDREEFSFYVTKLIKKKLSEAFPS